MSDEKYIKSLISEFGNSLLSKLNNANDFEENLGYIVYTLNELEKQSKISNDDIDYIFNCLIEILENRLQMNLSFFEQANTTTIDLVKLAKNKFKSTKKSSSDLLMSRKGLKK